MSREDHGRNRLSLCRLSPGRSPRDAALSELDGGIPRAGPTRSDQWVTQVDSQVRSAHLNVWPRPTYRSVHARLWSGITHPATPTTGLAKPTVRRPGLATPTNWPRIMPRPRPPVKRAENHTTSSSQPPPQDPGTGSGVSLAQRCLRRQSQTRQSRNSDPRFEPRRPATTAGSPAHRPAPVDDP